VFSVNIMSSSGAVERISTTPDRDPTIDVDPGHDLNCCGSDRANLRGRLLGRGSGHDGLHSAQYANPGDPRGKVR
jgi:hypothetical protein